MEIAEEWIFQKDDENSREFCDIVVEIVVIKVSIKINKIAIVISKAQIPCEQWNNVHHEARKRSLESFAIAKSARVIFLVATALHDACS